MFLTGVRGALNSVSVIMESAIISMVAVTVLMVGMEHSVTKVSAVQGTKLYTSVL